MKYSSLTMAAAFGNAIASAASSPHGGGGSISISIHPKRMDFGAISFGNHQGPVVMKEARFGGGIDGNPSTGGNDGGGGGLEVVTALTQDHLGGFYGHRGSAMVDVAVEGGGISGDPYGGEGCWGEGLGLANEVGSGVVTTAANVQEGTNWWEGDSGSGVQDVSSLAGCEDVVDIHESSGGDSGVFAVVSWRDSVQGLAVSRRDEMVSSKKNSDLVEDDTISGGEVESGDDGLEHPESPQLNLMQKILGSARMGGISGPLLIQQFIFFNDDLAISTNKGGAVDGAESEVTISSSNLTSPSSRAVVVRDEDPGASIHSIVDEDESAHVSKSEVSKDVLPESKNLSSKLKADDDGQVDPSVPSVQDTTVVDVSSDASTKTLEGTKDMPNSNRPNFLVGFVVLIFVMIMTAVSYLSYPRLMFMPAVELILGMMRFTYARDLYDGGCKNLGIVLKSVRSPSLLYPKSNHSEGKSCRKGRGRGKSRGKGHGKSRSKAKQKAASPQLTGYRSLLVLMVVTGVLCILGSGEAVWFSHNNDSEAAEKVNDLLDDGVVEEVSIETDSVGVNSSGDDDDKQDQVVFDQSINSVGLNGVALQDYGSVSGFVSLQNEMSEVHFELQKVVSDDTASDTDALKATSKALSLVEDRLVDLQLSKSLPSHLQHIVTSTLNQITKAEKHIQKVNGFISQYRGLDRSTNHRKLLSNNQDSSATKKKIQYKRSITKADHHMRAKSRHLGQGHHFLGSNHFGHHAGHQQGYRGARIYREEGSTTHRRLPGDDGTDICIEPSTVERKTEQCLRLAECSQYYGLYDMFIFLFGDDIDFDTGIVDDKIVVFDEQDLRGKLERVKGLSEDILDQFTFDSDGNGDLSGDTSILTPLDTDRTCPNGSTCLCDELLRQFHRYDEGLSVQGKWGGGSVTGVCRGWGTSRFISLESIFDIATTALDNDPVDTCVRDELDVFNQKVSDGTLLTEIQIDDDICSSSSTTSFPTLEGDVEYCCADSSCSEAPTCVIIDPISSNPFEEIQDLADNLNCITEGNIFIGSKPVCVLDTDVECQIVDVEVLVEVNIPTNPCSNVTDEVVFEGIWAESSFQSDLDEVKSNTKTLVDETFKCLYYSYFLSQTNYTCDNLGDPQKSDCNSACDEVRDPAFTIGASDSGSKNSNGLFDYDYSPASLVPQYVRSSFFQAELERDGVPSEALTAQSASQFVVDVFEQYMGCADGIVKELYSEFPNDVKTLFKPPNDDGTNPYAPDNDRQFQLPIRLNDYASVDEHGQFLDQSTFLDRVFDYVKIGDTGSDGLNGTGPGETPTFSTTLDQLLVDNYAANENIENLIEDYEDRIEELQSCPSGNQDLCDALTTIYNAIIASLQQILSTKSNQGLARSALDDSIALVFGNKTTIGSVCSYSRALEEELVDNIPGFCCLDAPYESNNWGETYSCQKYIPNLRTDASQGSTVVVQKNPSDCNRLGPVTSGFNQASCDIFQGTWCPNPRDCTKLVECVQDEKALSEGLRPAFFQYLDDAPGPKEDETIQDFASDTTNCEDLREYFEYDRDYPDDERICSEVKDLKCLTDFTNLDGFVTGTAGANDDVNADVQLAISDNIQAPIDTAAGSDSVNTCSGDASKVLRSTLFGLRQVVGIYNSIVKTAAEPARELCQTIPLIVLAGNGVDPKPVCIAPAVAAKTTINVAKVATELVLSIADRVYDEICVKGSFTYNTLRQDAIYNNAITNGRNIITTFAATQQLKVMLGDVQAGLEADREERDDQGRRLQSDDCVDTSSGFLTAPCSEVSCQDPTRLCDRSFNYPYISSLITAGCDDLDSDGDKQADVCEDRFPPNVLIRDAKLFRCDDNNTTRLCYTDKWFKNEKQVLNFLEYEFAAADDCAPSTKLNVTFDKDETASSTCENTKYTITPFQDYPDCNNRTNIGPFNLTFTNPLPGASKEVTVQLDEVAPVVECGFFPNNANSANMVDGKTLYHYLLKTEGGGRRLNDARLKDAGFFYTVAENCDADVHVDVVVESNELQQNTVAQLFKRKRTGFVEQAEFLYAPTHCDCEKKVDGLCKTDPSMEDLKTRYYNITVTASDSAGNTDSDTCRVVIVPSCNPETDPDCVEFDRPELPNVEDFYFNRSAVYNSVGESKVLNQVAREELTWKDGLATLDPEEETNEAVDVDVEPPVLTCSLGTQDLSGTGAGVFTDLGFSFNAVDGGKKCTDTKDLEVSIEVLSNEVVATGEEMVIISDSRVDGSPSIWAEDHTCKSSNNGKCKGSSTETLREYVVRVTATDESGNSNMVQCNTIVGGEQGDIAVGDPLFLIAKVYLIGGVDPEEDQDTENGETPGGEEAPWVTDDPTDSPSESSQPSLRPSTMPSSMPSSSSQPSSCGKQGEAPPNNDCSLCCSDRGCNNEGTCRRV